MDWRAWAIPVGLGLLAAGAAWWAFSSAGGKDGGSAEEEPDLVWVFEEGPVAVDGPHAVLAIAPKGNGPGAEVPETEGGERPDIGWETDFVGMAEADFHTLQCVRAPCPQPEGPWVLRQADEGAHQFGLEGYNATRLTFYAFNTEGQVLASNAPDGELARFELSEDFAAVPNVAWYLGTAQEAPEGTTKPPASIRALLSEARPLLEGLPEGGVASAATDEYEWLYGTLYLTVRIDALVYAP